MHNPGRRDGRDAGAAARKRVDADEPADGWLSDSHPATVAVSQQELALHRRAVQAASV